MIGRFTDLIAWQEAHKLVLLVYEVLKSFPQNEEYALKDQVRRCVVSISANIAEGFSRQSKKEKIQFYYIAKGSLTELENHFLIARDLNYISINQFDDFYVQLNLVGKLLTGLIKSAMLF